ncbi:MAG TPA: hypothetical protein VFV66_36625 [Nonomuraea sp.]|nr:hypothetical protein [Nonomuraea sp.]
MKQVYRSKTAFVMAWVWLAFVAFNVYDLISKYNGKPALVALAVLVALTALVYVIALRPATVLTETELVARNPLRTSHVTWAAVDDVTVSHSIGVHHGGDRVLRLWTPMAGARERARARRRGMPARPRGRLRAEPVLSKGEQAAQEAFAGKTHADWVGDQIRERAESARLRKEEAAPVRTVWAYDSLAALALAAVLVVVAIVIP